jgi:hypothetical protein
MAAAEERKQGPKRVRTADEIERDSRKDGLLLSRAKILNDIDHARDERHRAVLRQALAYIDSQIRDL